MQKTYTHVQFDVKGNQRTPSKSGKYPVYVTIIQGNKKAIINVLENVYPQDFQNKEKKWIKPSEPKAWEINAIINRIKNTIDQHIINLKVQNKNPSPKEVRNWYFDNHDKGHRPQSKSKTTFTDFFEDYISKLPNKRDFPAALAKLKKFNRPVGFDEMKRDYFKSLVSYLISDPDKLHLSSAHKYFSRVKQVYNEWCKVLDEDEFQNKRYYHDLTISTKRKKEPPTLSHDELIRLRGMTFGDTPEEKKREAVRDVFIFMCYTSRYISEVKALTFENNVFYEGKDKDKITIRSSRSKTKVPFENALYYDFVIDIFNKHNPTKKGVLFPCIDYSEPHKELNKHLKNFSKELNFPFKMTTKTARNTFISTVAYNLPDNLKIKMCGHTNIKTTNRYVVPDSSSQHDELERHWGTK